MSIHARFFDTLKRHKGGIVFCLLAVLGSAALAFPSGCIVTDKIEFEDAVNHPITIQRLAPQDTISDWLKEENDGTVTFSVTVTDADVTTAEPAENPIAAILEIQVDNWNETVLTDDGCSAPSLVEPTDTDASGPPVFQLECELALGDLDVGVDNLLQVTLIASDLGFYKKLPNPGANTAEVVWVLRMMEAVQ